MNTHQITLLLLLSCSLGAGCASQEYRPPDNGQQTTDFLFIAQIAPRSGDGSAQVLAFTDAKSCGKHPRGTYMGVLCPACGGMSLSQPIETGTSITLKYEYLFGGVFSEHGRCTDQFTLTPQARVKYRAIFRVNQGVCGTTVQSSLNGSDWADDPSVRYDKKQCTWW